VVTGACDVVVGVTVVVVGATVVVVVVGSVADVSPTLDGVVVVVEEEEVEEVDVVDEVDVEEVAVAALLPPGCSLATITPMRAVAPVARTAATCVSRRRRRTAWSRCSGVCLRVGRLMTGSFSRGVPLSHHGRFETVARPAVGFL
jgi:hypothetical protein